MSKVVTFGEIMLRLAPEGYMRFVMADKFLATYGGGEANVAIALANFGVDVAYVTKLPTHEIGQAALNSLRRFGVNTEYIARGGERLGVYYLEKGASQRGSLVIYDRASSSIATAVPNDFDWDEIFSDAEWFHFTGITPALGPVLVDICRQACIVAKQKGLKISCDLNYRAKLWSKAEANEVMSELCQYVDLLIANEEDAKDVFGIEAENSDIHGGKLDHSGYISVVNKLNERFNFEKVAVTLRSSRSASDNGWAGMLYDNGEFYFSKEYDIHIVDRVGGGDSFGAGLIYSFLRGSSPQQALEFATAASCLKHSIEGDFNMVSVSEVEKLSGGDASGRVQR